VHVLDLKDDAGLVVLATALVHEEIRVAVSAGAGIIAAGVRGASLDYFDNAMIEVMAWIKVAPVAMTARVSSKHLSLTLIATGLRCQ